MSSTDLSEKVDDRGPSGLASGRRVTIIDVARVANVSIKTVSRVINNEPTVSEEYRQVVEQVVEQLGYRPNISARALAGQRSYLIGLMFENPSPNYVSMLQVGAMAACRAAGFHLIVEQIHADSPEIAAELKRAVTFTNIDGVILSPPLSDHETVLTSLEEARVPFVRIAPNTFPGRAPSVAMDDRRAAYEMTEFLWEQGHRDIGFVAAPPHHAAATRRLSGFLAALEDRGQSVPEDYVVQGAFTARSGMEAGFRLLDLPRRPTAIFAANDEMAAGVMIAAYQRGLSLPDDLSVAGFDDSAVAQAVHPLLTTIRQPTSQMAEYAARHLIERAGKTETLLDFELVVRESVTAPPKR